MYTRSFALGALLGIAAGLTGCSSSPSDPEISDAMKAVTVTVGDDMSCAVTADSLAYCWGYQIGDGTLGSPRPVPVLLPPVRQIHAGRDEVCALTADGDVACWGDVRWAGESFESPVSVLQRLAPQLIQGGPRFTQVTVGLALDSCGITADGDAYCWPLLTPVLLGGGLSFVQIASGGASCGIVSEGRRAYCWGGNREGQVGDGTIALSVPLPVPVAGEISFQLVAPGFLHTWGLGAPGRPIAGARMFSANSATARPPERCTTGWCRG